MLVKFKHYKINLFIISVMPTPPRRILIMVVQLLAKMFLINLIFDCFKTDHSKKVSLDDYESIEPF